MGRVTHDMMASFWPTPEAMESMPEVAKGMNEMPKFVFSRTLGRSAWSNTTILEGDVPSEVRRLKSETGLDLTILGSGTIVAQLAETDLIDSYQFVVVPVFLGKGRTMFEGVRAPQALKLASRARSATAGSCSPTNADGGRFFEKHSFSRIVEGHSKVAKHVIAEQSIARCIAACSVPRAIGLHGRILKLPAAQLELFRGKGDECSFAGSDGLGDGLRIAASEESMLGRKRIAQNHCLRCTGVDHESGRNWTPANFRLALMTGRRPENVTGKLVAEELGRTMKAR